ILLKKQNKMIQSLYLTQTNQSNLYLKQDHLWLLLWDMLIMEKLHYWITSEPRKSHQVKRGELLSILVLIMLRQKKGWFLFLILLAMKHLQQCVQEVLA